LREALKFDGGEDWHRLVGCVRYVDDLISASRVYCLSCIKGAVKETYPSTCLFSMEDRGPDGSVQWLDLTVKPDDDNIIIEAKYEELDWLDGNSPQPKKWRMPPGNLPCKAEFSELFSLAERYAVVAERKKSRCFSRITIVD